MDLDPALEWRDVAGSGFNRHIGPIRFAEREPGRYVAALTLRDIHINIGGVCHGGVLLSLADIAMGASTYAAGGNRPCATIDLDAKFIAAAKEGQTLVAETRQLRLVRALSFMECEIEAGGRLVMRAGGIWKYLETGPG